MSSIFKQFIICFFAGISAFAQNAADDFNKINKAQAEIEKLSMNILYTVYANHTTPAFIDRQTGVYKKNHSSSYNSLMQNETIVNGAKMITINSSHKEIMLSTARAINGSDISGIKLNGLMKNYEVITPLHTGKNERAYVVTPKGKNRLLDKFEIHFNADNYLITKIVLYYAHDMEFSNDGKGRKDKPRLEIEFQNINTDPNFAKADFDLGHYIVFGKKNTLNPAYQSYHLIETKK